MKRLEDRVREHAAHGGSKCDKMQHDKAIEQAAKALLNALEAAGSCVTEQEKQEVKDWIGNLYQGAVDILYDNLQALWKQLTTMPKQPSFGPSNPYGPPIWGPVNPILYSF